MQKTAKITHPAQRADAMRQKAMNVAMRRKEEFLGARVPKTLKDKVIRRADELGIPVSLLLRKVLEDVFAEEQTVLKLDLIKHARQVATPNTVVFEDVLAWKTILLNRSCQCEACGRDLHAGDEAAMGISRSDKQTPIVCCDCQHDAVNKADV